ncbi:NAD(P)-binding domain-containing protein, partial [Halorubrum sp. AD140]|uniref:NAD(P)-binding domain-containing protein n=1 Tax=Halorubrum sp. AD140 TaxID=3050073 RepID=UPI002ACC3EF5
MELGVIGLGRMGRIVANRSLEAGHDGVAFDLSAEATAEVAERGAEPADSVADLCERLDDGAGEGKRIWLMVPAGDAVDATLADLEPHLDGDDVVVDGGNSHFEASVRRAGASDAAYLACGPSG